MATNSRAAVQGSNDVWLIFPHQLFESNTRLAANSRCIFLIEEPLYFTLYRFHKQKLILQRAAMRMHADHLRGAGAEVHLIEGPAAADLTGLFARINRLGVGCVNYIDVVDDWLERRIRKVAETSGSPLRRHDTPMFLATMDALSAHFETGARPSMARFYAAQRRSRGVLMVDGAPSGGRWSYDVENRRRLPAKIRLPQIQKPASNDYVREAKRYVDLHFSDSPGSADSFDYPVTYADARAWLADFCSNRLADFGAYEDAVSKTHEIIFHSVLTPMLNVGLLTPDDVLDAALARADVVPLNSLEGFVRQVLGWREYVRGAYVFRGRAQRTRNFWSHSRTIPQSFWQATTGITPIDRIIERVLKTGYAHHIERLMILSSFMQLCEFEPDQVYRWFMELFIDSFDWVMVPNVYGMGLYADGGSITTKPYICGSNYILKMSDFGRGPWCEVWDGLFWRFINKHQAIIGANPRMHMMVESWNRMPAAKRQAHLEAAEHYLAGLN